MPKIKELLEQYGIEREKLAAAYKAVIGKTLLARATQIKDEERAQIEPSLSLAKIGKPKKSETTKVFKAEEVSFGDDFLSGLWFAPKEEEVIEEEEKEQVEVFSQPFVEEKEEEPVVKSFGNARVIWSSPIEEKPKGRKGKPTKWQIDNQPYKKDAEEGKPFERRQTQESETRGKTFYKFSAAPTFSKWVAKPWKQPKERTIVLGWQAKSEKTPSAPKQPVVKKEAGTSSTLVKKQEILMGDTISVKEFSEKMWVTFPELMKKFMANKILININSTVDYDTAALIWEEFGVKVRKEAGTVSVEDVMSWNLHAILDIDKEAETKEKRTPIVTIMGHVDHGKTSLLDYLRHTNVIGGEAGGITQSIGASQIIHNNEKITFIDTPWHELFTSLRARGAKITNVVVIVIACDDGIKPQTVEAINHAKDAWVPIIVAITKIDKWITNYEHIKTQMAEHGLTPEEWWGDVPIVPVSAFTGQGIDTLLEQVLLQSEMLELHYNPDRNAVGVVLEANKDTKQGILTTILVMTGTLEVGDIIMIHNTYGKVRKMLDWSGKEVKKVVWGDPVMILGMQELPEPGRIAEVVDTEQQARHKIATVQEKEKAQSDASWLQNMMAQIAAGDLTTLNIILKADSFGSLEAAKYALQTMEVPENITIKIVHSDVGVFGDSDLGLAQASWAMLFWFNIAIPASIIKKAEQMKLSIKTYDIIYEMTDYIDGVLKGMIKIEAKEVVLGKLQVLGVFFKKEKEMIIGGKVTEWEARNGAEFRMWRKWDSGELETIGQWRITSLKREQENVNKVTEWHECGMKVRISKKVLEGDILEFFVME